jgi:hypothetical protein
MNTYARPAEGAKDQKQIKIKIKSQKPKAKSQKPKAKSIASRLAPTIGPGVVC